MYVKAEYLASEWGYALKDSKPTVSSVGEAKPVEKEQPPKIDKLHATLQLELEKKSDDLNLYHPYFGLLVSDLRYKRLYLTNVRSLSVSPTWEKQRIFRPERAQHIATSKRENGTSRRLPGVITFFNNKLDGRCGIIDGQHRAASLLLQAVSEKWDVSERIITVEVFDVESDEEVDSLFREINSGEAVRLVDMPNEMSINERNVMEEAVSHLMESHLQFFKMSSHCKYPHLHLDTFRDELHRSGLISRRSLDNAQKLTEYFWKVNEKLSKRSDEKWLEIIGHSISHAKAVKKARAFNFFLGLDKTWMDE